MSLHCAGYKAWSGTTIVEVGCDLDSLFIYDQWYTNGLHPQNDSQLFTAEPLHCCIRQPASVLPLRVLCADGLTLSGECRKSSTFDGKLQGIWRSSLPVRKEHFQERSTGGAWVKHISLHYLSIPEPSQPSTWFKDAKTPKGKANSASGCPFLSGWNSKRCLLSFPFNLCRSGSVGSIDLRLAGGSKSKKPHISSRSILSIWDVSRV